MKLTIFYDGLFCSRERVIAAVKVFNKIIIGTLIYYFQLYFFPAVIFKHNGYLISYLFIYYLKILPNWRVSEAIPSNTEPVPFNVPLIVPQEKSMKFKSNIIISCFFIFSSLNCLYHLSIILVSLYQTISIQLYGIKRLFINKSLSLY